MEKETISVFIKTTLRAVEVKDDLTDVCDVVRYHTIKFAIPVIYACLAKGKEGR